MKVLPLHLQFEDWGPLWFRFHALPVYWGRFSLCSSDLCCTYIVIRTLLTFYLALAPVWLLCWHHFSTILWCQVLGTATTARPRQSSSAQRSGCRSVIYDRDLLRAETYSKSLFQEFPGWWTLAYRAIVICTETLLEGTGGSAGAAAGEVWSLTFLEELRLVMRWMEKIIRH